MPVRRTLLALLCCVAIAHGQTTGVKVELRTLKGNIVNGELVSVSPAEVVIQTSSGKVTTATPQVLGMDLLHGDKPTPPEKFTDVELTDGTILHCLAVSMKERNVHLALVSGQELDLTLGKLSNLVNEAQDPKRRKEWTQQLAKKRRGDVLAVLKEGVLNALIGNLGAASADGKTISFDWTEINQKVNKPLNTIHGLVWERAPDPAMPLPICKLIDVYGSTVFVHEVAVKGGEVTVTTPIGMKLTYPLKAVQRFDYKGDKLKYLAELDVLELKVASDEEFRKGPVADLNLDKNQIKLGDTVYVRGMSYHANTDVIYDLRGDYREFKAFAGIDKTVGKDHKPVVLIIECDGRERVRMPIAPTDKDPFQALSLNVKDVLKLRIQVLVGEGQLTTFGAHLTLANAQVLK
jgi:hypothetical protein